MANPARGNGCCRVHGGWTCWTRRRSISRSRISRHGLAFVARWNGQTLGTIAYSVAEHSLLVERLFFAPLSPVGRAPGGLAALLHDAPEYVIGDMISPGEGGRRAGIRRDWTSA